MANQYSNYHGKSVAAKDIASYSDYLDRYDDASMAASNWMHDDSNIHFANYVRDNDEVWEKWVKSGKTDKKDMWDFGHQDWHDGGGKMKDRYLAKILKTPGDLNKTGSEWDDMGVVGAFKSARWGYDDEAQKQLTASYAKDHWGKAGYGEGREMRWLDKDDLEADPFATTVGVPFKKEWNPDDEKMTKAYKDWQDKSAENIHYEKYVDTHKDLRDAFDTHVKPHGNQSKWDWGKEHYEAHGQGEGRGVSYIIDRPGDLDKDGNIYNDMVTTAGSNNPTHLFGTDSTKGKWAEYYWKNNPVAGYAPESAMSAPDRPAPKEPTSGSGSTGPKTPSDNIFNPPSFTNTTPQDGDPPEISFDTDGEKDQKAWVAANPGKYSPWIHSSNYPGGVVPKDPSFTVNADGTAQYSDTFGRPSKDSGWDPRTKPGQQDYSWVNNQTGEVWKPKPSKWGDPPPGKKHSPSDGPFIDWPEDPRLNDWTKSTTPKPKYGYGVDQIGSSNPDDPLAGDTYVGRGWANYWQQSIPDVDPNWSNRFVNQYVKFGDQNQVVNRENLIKRIQARSQHHMDQADYLGYLSRGQMLGQNRPKWNQPGTIKSDYQPDININPFLQDIYNIGKKK